MDWIMKKFFIACLLLITATTVGMQNSKVSQLVTTIEDDNWVCYGKLVHDRGLLVVQHQMTLNGGALINAAIEARRLVIHEDFSGSGACDAFSIDLAWDCTRFTPTGPLKVTQKMKVENPATLIQLSPHNLFLQSFVKNKKYMGCIKSSMGENGWGTIKVLDYENESLWSGLPTYEFDGRLKDLEEALSEGITQARSLDEFVSYLRQHLVPPQPKPTALQQLWAIIGL